MERPSPSEKAVRREMSERWTSDHEPDEREQLAERVREIEPRVAGDAGGRPGRTSTNEPIGRRSAP